VAQIPDIDVLVRVPPIGPGLEHRIRDPRVAFPPGMVRRGAPAYNNADPRRRRWVGGVPDLPIRRSVMADHVPVVLLPARQEIAAAHRHMRCATRSLRRIDGQIDWVSGIRGYNK